MITKVCASKVHLLTKISAAVMARQQTLFSLRLANGLRFTCGKASKARRSRQVKRRLVTFLAVNTGHK